MDSAVGLVQTYLRVNGYFTVSEYPVVELRREYQTATDLDILAFRFPGAERAIPGEKPPTRRRRDRFRVDPELRMPADRADMIVGEVKEGPAEFNPSASRREVIAAALARFGCCPGAVADGVVRNLVTAGEASTPAGHAVRLIAFGSTGGTGGSVPYQRMTLGHVVRFLKRWVRDNWEVLRHTQSKDPVLGFLLTLQKASRDW